MINQNSERLALVYDFDEHRHRYAIWTVARAQRAFEENGAIATAMEKTDLRSFVENTSSISQAQFDDQHRVCCEAIIEYFTPDKCAYVRAAKMAAIYLKTAVILPGMDSSQLCVVIHPPIDRVLLHCLAEKTPLKHFRKINWTRATDIEYWGIVKDLRATFGKCNW